MSKLVNLTLEGFINEAASGNPTPGGGSVSAAAAGLGAALGMMVGNLTINKKGYDELSADARAKMEQNFKMLEVLKTELIDIVDTDSTAFDGVMAAFKLPKSTDEEKKLRSEAIQKGYIKALEVPMSCAENCLKSMRLLDVFAEYGNKNAISDVGVGMLLCYAGLEGALFNVSINLGSIKDDNFVKGTSEKVKNMLCEGKRIRDDILNIVYSKL